MQLEGCISADSLARSKIKNLLQLTIESRGVVVVDKAETGGDPNALPRETHQGGSQGGQLDVGDVMVVARAGSTLHPSQNCLPVLERRRNPRQVLRSKEFKLAKQKVLKTNLLREEGRARAFASSLPVFSGQQAVLDVSKGPQLLQLVSDLSELSNPLYLRHHVLWRRSLVDLPH